MSSSSSSCLLENLSTDLLWTKMLFVVAVCVDVDVAAAAAAAAAAV